MASPQDVVPAADQIAKRKYSRRVCAECTRRHCKCDGIKPQCAPCRTADHECVWPEKKRGPRLNEEVVELRGRIEQLEATVKFLTQELHTRGQQAIAPLVIPEAGWPPLTPVSSGPSSPFPSSAESSPRPGSAGLPILYAAQHANGDMLAVPNFDHRFPRRHARTPSSASSASEGSLSAYDVASQSSSPNVPAFVVDPAPPHAWHGPAGFNGSPNSSAFPNVSLNVMGTEPGRPDCQGMFGQWRGGSGALQGGDSGLDLNVAAKDIWEDMLIGDATMDG